METNEQKGDLLVVAFAGIFIGMAFGLEAAWMKFLMTNGLDDIIWPILLSLFSASVFLYFYWSQEK